MMAATATSMAVIALVSGGGFLIYLTGAHPPLPLLGGLAAGAVGVLGGNLLAQRLGGPTLQRLFALMLVAVSFSWRRRSSTAGSFPRRPGHREAALCALLDGHAMSSGGYRWVGKASAGSPGKDRRRDCLS